MLDTCPIVCESDTSRRIRHVMRTWLLCLVLNNVQFILVAIIPSQLFVIFLVVTFPKVLAKKIPPSKLHNQNIIITLI